MRRLTMTVNNDVVIGAAPLRLTTLSRHTSAEAKASRSVVSQRNGAFDGVALAEVASVNAAAMLGDEPLDVVASASRIARSRCRA